MQPEVAILTTSKLWRFLSYMNSLPSNHDTNTCSIGRAILGAILKLLTLMALILFGITCLAHTLAYVAAMLFNGIFFKVDRVLPLLIPTLLAGGLMIGAYATVCILWSEWSKKRKRAAKLRVQSAHPNTVEEVGVLSVFRSMYRKICRPVMLVEVHPTPPSWPHSGDRWMNPKDNLVYTYRFEAEPGDPEGDFRPTITVDGWYNDRGEQYSRDEDAV